MSNFIKLNMFLPKEDSGRPENMVIETWVDKDRIVLLQDTTKVEQEYKSFVILDGIDEGVRFIETVETIRFL
jgi:hypothetical protein